MSMDEQALKQLLHSLIERWESEVVEFKRGGKGFSTSDLGKYLSALANEANLRACESAWQRLMQKETAALQKETERNSI
ncbi:hypothetical protein F8A90_06405 [Cobetia sp. cqz5-12]|uniref:hypothetical protein n=1 Tax=Cobetia sp. cqz5-12 TaxID=2609415 RepID=UPI0019072A12|nr:hypothetical protein [Cobetia sp. cqz5-12]QQK63795.1 hypothetical protein F8A90_06405 [Cobetia sp. cqz5-12]